jgi:hypothetical protein
MLATLLILTLTRTSHFPPATGLHVRGDQILTPKGRPIQLRGFNVCWWVPPTEQDAKDIVDLGGNCIRCMFGYTPGGRFDPTKVAEVKGQVRYFTSHGLWVIPVVHDFRKDGKGPYDLPELNQEFLAMWDYVVTELKDEPMIAAWEPINEPHDSPAPTVAAWYKEVVRHFRALDPVRPIVVEGTGYSWPENLEPGLLQDDPNIIYAFHTYGPWEYTSQKRDAKIPYPGKWDKSTVAKAIEPAVLFRQQYHVPVWCGEFGVPTMCPGFDRWIADVGSILETDRLPWCYWGWAKKPQNPTDDTFDVNTSKPEAIQAMKGLFNKARKN